MGSFFETFEKLKWYNFKNDWNTVYYFGAIFSTFYPHRWKLEVDCTAFKLIKNIYIFKELSVSFCSLWSSSFSFSRNSCGFWARQFAWCSRVETKTNQNVGNCLNVWKRVREWVEKWYALYLDTMLMKGITLQSI